MRDILNKFLSRPASAVLLSLATLFSSPVLASGGSSLPTWAKFDPGKISVGAVIAQEYRFFEATETPDGLGYTRARFHSNGLVGVAATKYALLDYLKLFVGYGMATKEGQPFHQIAAAGVEYTDLFGVTFGLGTEMDDGVDKAFKRDNLLILLGVAFNPFEFNLIE